MNDPKVMFFDIETSPFLAWLFRIGSKVSVSYKQILEGSHTDIICICWKWAGEKKVHSLDWGKKQDSAMMIEEFTKEVEKADLVIGHNAAHFDVKHVNTQRFRHNQPPIAWPEIEDTLTQFRKYFNLPCFKLDYLSDLLVQSRKDAMELQDWIDVINKKPKALDTMIKYCKKDVILLEKVHEKAKTYFKPKINAGLIAHGARFDCPRCACKDKMKFGVRYTLARKYQRYACKACGTVYQGETIKN